MGWENPDRLLGKKHWEFHRTREIEELPVRTALMCAFADCLEVHEDLRVRSLGDMVKSRLEMATSADAQRDRFSDCRHYWNSWRVAQVSHPHRRCLAKYSHQHQKKAFVAKLSRLETASTGTPVRVPARMLWSEEAVVKRK